MSWRTLPRYTLSTAVSVPGVTSLSSGPTSMRPAWSSSSTVGVVHQLRSRADYGVDAATGDRMQVESATTSDRARDRPRWWSNRRNLVTLPPSYATHLHRYPGGHRPDVPGSSQRTGFPSSCARGSKWAPREGGSAHDIFTLTSERSPALASDSHHRNA